MLFSLIAHALKRVVLKYILPMRKESNISLKLRFCFVYYLFTDAFLFLSDQWCENTVCCTQNERWRPEEHRQVREELLGCLDKMMCMEKNFMDAQNEIQMLRQYVKVTCLSF